MHLYIAVTFTRPFRTPGRDLGTADDIKVATAKTIKESLPSVRAGEYRVYIDTLDGNKFWVAGGEAGPENPLSEVENIRLAIESNAKYIVWRSV